MMDAFEVNNNNNNSNQTDLLLEVSSEWQSISYRTKAECFGLISIKAPLYESISRASRAPIDLIAVIDKSDSMTGSKIKLVKEAIMFAIQQLKEEDSFGLILYSNSVETAIPLVKMAPQAKQAALSSIESITTKGGTNLSGGLFQALMSLKQYKSNNDVASILLFTDGLANIGIVQTPKIVLGMENLLKEIDKPCSVFTFGFGADHSATMLKDIADSSNGLYYFIENQQNIPQSFADCIGGLLSVTAQNIEIVVQTPMKSNVQIKKVLTKYKITEQSPQIAKISIGDLYSEEERDIPVLIEIPEVEQAYNDYPVLEVELRYKNTITKQTTRMDKTVVIARPHTAPAQKPNIKLLVQQNRITAADALEKAKKQADSGDLSGARSCIQTAMTALSSSPSGNDEFTLYLVKELEDCLKELRDEKAYVVGSKKMANYAMAHHQQRSNHINSPYITNVKKSMIGKSPFANFAYPRPTLLDMSKLPSYSAAPPHYIPPSVHSYYSAPAVPNKIRLLIGNEHSLIPKHLALPSETGAGKMNTHQWKAFVRDINGKDLSSIIEKVIFHLHPTFKPSIITVTSSPFEVEKTGWGIFPLRIKIHFHAKYSLPPMDVEHKLVFIGGGGSSTYDVNL